MRVVFDLDGVICNNTFGAYGEAKPFDSIVREVNKLFDNGDYVIILTARGMGTCNGDRDLAADKWLEFTTEQLESWGVRYNELHFGKPEADLYVDDKAFSIKPDGSCAGYLNKRIGQLRIDSALTTLKSNIFGLFHND